MSLFPKILPLLSASQRGPLSRAATPLCRVPQQSVNAARRHAVSISASTVVNRGFSSSARWRREDTQASVEAESKAAAATNADKGKERLKVEPRLSITFTCTASIPSLVTATSTNPLSTTATTSSPSNLEPEQESEPQSTKCLHRSTHEFTKRSYEKGIVLIQCPGCKNRHLIADHLGWFEDSTLKGKNPTIEDIIRAKGLGETVKRGVKYEPASFSIGNAQEKGEGEMGDLEVLPEEGGEEVLLIGSGKE